MIFINQINELPITLMGNRSNYETMLKIGVINTMMQKIFLREYIDACSTKATYSMSNS
jgi:hypothetical protein